MFRSIEPAATIAAFVLSASTVGQVQAPRPTTHTPSALPVPEGPAATGMLNGDFENGLDQWTVQIVGGTPTGSVAPVDGQAQFLEGDSFLATLWQTFIMPAGRTTLEFDVFFEPGFDTSDAFIPDAFEVQLLDSDFESVVPTWSPTATSFFNVQEDLSTNLGSGVTFDGQHVTLDVTGVAPGTLVTLYLDFIGADGDTAGGVRVDDFIGLEGGGGPGQIDPEGSTDRVLRGYIVAYAVNADGDEVRWNHLSGQATVVDYRDKTAWSYPTWASPIVDPVTAHGLPSGTPGELRLDGIEYGPTYDQLLLEFQAAGSSAWSSSAVMVTSQSDLTLHPVDLDLTDGTDGPIITTAHFDVWNENEVKLSGTHRCVSCWNETLLANYGIPNHLTVAALQTDHGKARIDGIASALCPDSVDTAMLGVIARPLRYDGALGAATSGRPLVGMGTQAATMRFDISAPPPELPHAPDVSGRDRNDAATDEHLADGSSDRGTAEAHPAGPTMLPDRLNGTEKGSLLIFSKIELRWNQAGQLVQDTFIEISNDHPDDVRVQMFFINGEAPGPGDPEQGEPPNPGWNWVDNQILLTGNQPGWWSAATGLPFGVSPFTVLDPAP